VVDERAVLHRGTFRPHPAYPGGAGDAADIAVVVFDEPGGESALLGSESGAAPPGTTVISVANVTVAYSRSEEAPDRSVLIRKALETARAR